jgi:hypothetical protein
VEEPQDLTRYDVPNALRGIRRTLSPEAVDAITGVVETLYGISQLLQDGPSVLKPSAVGALQAALRGLARDLDAAAADPKAVPVGVGFWLEAVRPYLVEEQPG